MEFWFNITDFTRPTATISIEAESIEKVKELIEEVGIDDIINNPEEHNADVEWDDDMYQADWQIVGEIKGVSNEKGK